MILKKPYAFLIKHFKLIHLLLLIPLVYLFSKTFSIANFLNIYVKASYYTSEVDIASHYINYFMYLSTIVIILITLAIYFLMRQKKKDTRFYIFLMIYYLFIFILISITHGILGNIEDASITAQSIRLFRDLSYLFYLPELYFISYAFLRGLGFNIKKFDFESDAKELEINDVDSEEFELIIGENAYKYKRQIRRILRELSYYIRENSLAFGIIVFLSVVIISTFLYLNFGVYNKTYRQTSKIGHNNLIIKVNNSVLSNLDQGGNIIDGKYYMALTLNITNNNKTDTVLDYENFKLEVNKRMISPVLDRGYYFPDFGITYKRGTLIPSGTTNNYVLTYEIDEALINEVIKLKILDEVTYKLGDIKSTYKTVNLKYKKIFNTVDKDTTPLGKYVMLNGNMGTSNLNIESYKLSDSYNYTYKSCTNNYCQNLDEFVKSNSNTTLMILKYNLSLDKYTPYYSLRKGTKEFVNDFVSIRYKIDDKVYNLKVTNIASSNADKTWIFEVPKTLKYSSDISLIVTIRENNHIMELV